MFKKISIVAFTLTSMYIQAMQFKCLKTIKKTCALQALMQNKKNYSYSVDKKDLFFKAIKNKDLDTVKKSLENGDVCVSAYLWKYPHYYSLSAWAMINGNKEIASAVIAKVLLHKNPIVGRGSFNGNPIIFVVEDQIFGACNHNYVTYFDFYDGLQLKYGQLCATNEYVKSLIEEQMLIQKNTNKYLHDAIGKKDLNAVRKALKNDADINAFHAQKPGRYLSALGLAIESRNTEIVKEILEQKPRGTRAVRIEYKKEAGYIHYDSAEDLAAVNYTHYRDDIIKCNDLKPLKTEIDIEMLIEKYMKKVYSKFEGCMDDNKEKIRRLCYDTIYREITNEERILIEKIIEQRCRELNEG